MRPPASPSDIALRYALFAAIAIAANLLTQAGTLQLYAGPLPLVAAMAAGTAVGLVVKYELDRRLIFYAPDSPLASRTFVYYATTGLFTTAIFWGVETLAYLASGKELWALYSGGFAGLVIGNIVKYRLDKRYVFAGGGAGAGEARK